MTTKGENLVSRADERGIARRFKNGLQSWERYQRSYELHSFRDEVYRRLPTLVHSVGHCKSDWIEPEVALDLAADAMRKYHPDRVTNARMSRKGWMKGEV